MKKTLNLFLVVCLMVSFTSVGLFAEQQEDFSRKKDIELIFDQAVLRIAEFQMKINGLKTKLEDLKKEITELKSNIEKAKADLTDCKAAVLAAIGASEQDVNDFRQKFGVIQGKARQLDRLSGDDLVDRQGEIDELEAQLNELRMIKIAVLPEFFDKIIATAKQIRGLRDKPVSRPDTYIVQSWAISRDCLWNIAGRIEFLGDPLLWPKIWQANLDNIRNPDIIRTGMELVIPNKTDKTDDEMRLERRYWRQKREMQEDMNTGSEKGN